MAPQRSRHGVRPLRRCGAWSGTRCCSFSASSAVAGLGVAGYLNSCRIFYGQLGPTVANISIGVLGAAFDNIPLMFAVLTMNPEMSSGQWMPITLSTGVGGSLVSIGSAAAWCSWTGAQPLHVHEPSAVGVGDRARFIASILTHLVNAGVL